MPSYRAHVSQRKKILSTAAAVALGLGGLVAVAAPAQAAAFSYAVDCAAGSAFQSVTAATGDTITLTVSGVGTCQYVSVGKEIIASSSDVSITGGGSPSATDQTTYWDWTGSSAITRVDITLTITGSGQINFTSSGFVGGAFAVSSGGGGGAGGAGGQGGGGSGGSSIALVTDGVGSVTIVSSDLRAGSGGAGGPGGRPGAPGLDGSIGAGRIGGAGGAGGTGAVGGDPGRGADGGASVAWLDASSVQQDVADSQFEPGGPGAGGAGAPTGNGGIAADRLG